MNTERISGLGNPKIKQIRALRTRKERDRTGLFLVEGIRIVAEAVELGDVRLCVVAPDLLESSFAWEVIEGLQGGGTPCLEVTAEVFRSVSGRERPQGIAAVVRQRWEPLEHVRLASELCWVALDAPGDPGNLGSVLRTSDAVGGGGVVLVGPSADPYDPVAVRASMGALFSQRLVRATLDELAAWKHRHGYRFLGTSGSAVHDYAAVLYGSPLVVFMGSERHGLTADEQALCDDLVRIPMVGRSDSLNLAVATGVILYTIFNQRRGALRGSSSLAPDQEQ